MLPLFAPSQPSVLTQALFHIPTLASIVLHAVTPSFTPVYRHALAILLLLLRRAGHAALAYLCPEGHLSLHRLICVLAQGCHAVIDASFHKVGI